MSIETRWYSDKPIRLRVWDRTPEALADLRELTGQDLVDDGGVLRVTSTDGKKVYEVQKGQSVLEDEFGFLVRDAVRVSELRTEDPHAA